MSDAFLAQFRRFLYAHRTTKSHEATHTCMEGGKFDLSDDAALEEFRRLVSVAITHGHVMPPISEIHTPKFPLFVDIDLVTRARALARAHVVELVQLLVQRVALFYAGHATSSGGQSGGQSRQSGGQSGAKDVFAAVVLARNGEARPAKEGSDRYKHGLHVHWPHLIVDVSIARDVRDGMLAGLMAHDWSATLDVLATEWPQVVDEAPFGERGGLRVMGCSKKGCPHCYARNAVACAHCLGEVDMRSYALLACVDAGGEAAELERQLRAKAARLVRYTSVRSAARAVTPGFAHYSGFTAGVRSSGTGKRKAPADGDAHRGTTTAARKPVVNRKLLAIARRHLVAHAPEYANTVPQMFVSGKTRYRVDLLYDGSRYCINKGSEHKQNRAYMVIEKRNDGRCVSYMRCYCKCAVVRDAGGRQCPLFMSSIKTLETAEKNQLFATDGVVSESVRDDAREYTTLPEGP